MRDGSTTYRKNVSAYFSSKYHSYSLQLMDSHSIANKLAKTSSRKPNQKVPNQYQIKKTKFMVNNRVIARNLVLA